VAESWVLVAFAAAVLLLGFAARLAFDRWRVPDLLVLTAAGIAIGPGGLGLVPPDVFAGITGAAGPFLAVTVAFVMMEAGIHLTLSGRRAVTLLIVLHTSVACALTFAASWAVVRLAFGMSDASAIVIAAATLGPSALVLGTLATRLKIRPETRQALLFEGVVANVVGFFVVMSLPGMGAAPAGPAGWAAAGVALALACMVAAGAGLAWGFALSRLHPREGVFIATLAIALVVYSVSSGPLFGNGAVAAFVFGAVLRRAGGIAPSNSAASGNGSAASDLGRFHQEASFLVRTFFFLYLGLIFAPAALTASGIVLAVVLLAVFVVARLPSVALLARLWGLGRPDFIILQGSVSRGLSDILMVIFGISTGFVPASEAPTLAAVAVVLLFLSLTVNAGAVVAADRSRRSMDGPEAPPPSSPPATPIQRD
jgi:cell volume regulation protein A